MSSNTMGFEKLLEAVPDALVGMDQKGVIRFVNRQTEALFDYDRDQLIGRPVETLVPEPLWQIYAQNREDYFADPRTRSSGLEVELTGRHHDGTEFPVNISMAHIDTGDVLLVITAVADVTRHQVAVRNARLLAAIVDASDDAIIGTTLEGVITSWNPAAERIYGYAAKEIIGRPGSILATPDHDKEMHTVLARTRAGEVVEHLEISHLRKDGSLVPISLTVAPISDENGTVVGSSAVARDVTDQRRAFEAAQRMAAIVESTDDAMLSGSLDGTITSWNPAAEKLYGYSSQEIVGKSINLLIPQDRRGEIKLILAKIEAGRRVARLETIRVRKDGTVFPVSVTISPIRDADGTVVGTSAIHRDMTEHEHAAHYARGLIEVDPDPLGLISLDGTVLDLNEATVKAIGVPRDELIGTDFSQYWTDLDKAREAVVLTLAQGSITDYPMTARHRDGTLTDYLCNARLYRDINGDVLGVLVAARDVTAQKKAFVASQRLASIVEYSQDAIISGSLDGDITSWNPAAERLFGYSSKDVVGMPATVLVPKDRSGEVPDVLDKIKAGQHVKEFETLRVRKDGTVFPISLTVSPTRDADGVIIGTSVIYRDLTEQKRAEQAVEQDRDLLRATMDSLMDPHVLLEPVRDEAGQIVDFMFADANPAACEYAGKTYDELIGMRLPDLFHDGAQPDSLVDQCSRVIATGEPLTLDDIVYTQGFSGQEYHFDIRGAGVGVGLSFTWRDVTDRHAAAQWLAESEEHFRLLAENASDVVMRLSPDRRFEWISGSVGDVLGWAAPDLLGQVIDEFIHPEDLGPFRQSVAGTSSESVASTEFRFRRSDDSYRWVLCHTRLNLGQDSAPVDLVGGLIDIEARKAVEAHELDRLETLERFQRLTLGRELKMVELKKEIENLRSLAHKDEDENSDKP